MRLTSLWDEIGRWITRPHWIKVASQNVVESNGTYITVDTPDWFAQELSAALYKEDKTHRLAIRARNEWYFRQRARNRVRRKP